MPGAHKPTAHEMLELNELIRVESMEVQKVQAMLPMIGDPDLRQELSQSVQTASTHVKAMVDYVRQAQLVQV